MYVDKLRGIEERMVWLRGQLSEMEPSDQEYAVLYCELEKWERSYPEFIVDESPTQKEFERFDGEISILLNRKVNEIAEQAELIDYLAGVEQSVSLQLLPKGIEVELHYEHGRLRYSCIADDSASGKDVSAILASSQDVPRYISYDEPLTVRGSLFYTSSFQELNPEIDLLCDRADREIQRNRRMMVFRSSSLLADLPFLAKLGFLVPYYRVFNQDSAECMADECEAMLTYSTGYELKGVLLSTGEEEVFYRPAITKSRLDGKTVVITGVLSKRRYDFRKDIEALGGTLAGTVTKTVDFLLMGTNGTGTTKYQKAMKLGIPIMTEEQFKDRYDVK